MTLKWGEDITQLGTARPQQTCTKRMLCLHHLPIYIYNPSSSHTSWPNSPLARTITPQKTYMPLSPTLSPHITKTSPYLTAQETIDQLQDDFLDLDISLPSSRGNERAGKRSPRLSAVGGGGGKKLGKKKVRSREIAEGEW